jgi:hypothetical protein
MLKKIVRSRRERIFEDWRKGTVVLGRVWKKMMRVVKGSSEKNGRVGG